MTLFCKPVPANAMLFLACYLFLFLLEGLRPRRPLGMRRLETFHHSIRFCIFFGLSLYLPHYCSRYLHASALIDLSSIQDAGGIALMVFLHEGAYYVVQRAIHRNPFIRKFVITVPRQDAISGLGNLFTHSEDAVGWTILMSICLSTLTTLQPQDITSVLLTLRLITVLCHLNSSRPAWLRFLVRNRGAGAHEDNLARADNYANLPLFDMIFGTFRSGSDRKKSQGRNSEFTTTVTRGFISIRTMTSGKSKA